MLTLHNPWMLTALAVIPLLVWYFRKRRRPTVVISSIAPVKRVSRPRRLQVAEVIYLAALALLILALARPRSPLGRVVERRQGLDIVLAIDLSGSMQAIDRPANLPGEKFIQALNAGKVPGAKTVADVKEFYEKQIPMHRGCLPVDVAKAIIYAVEQLYETGQAIPVSGGQVMLN